MAIEKLCEYKTSEVYLFQLSLQCLATTGNAMTWIHCTVRRVAAWKTRTDFSYKENAYKHGNHHNLKSPTSVSTSHRSVTLWLNSSLTRGVLSVKFDLNRLKKSVYIALNTARHLWLAYVSLSSKLKLLSRARSEQGEQFHLTHTSSRISPIPGTNAFSSKIKEVLTL